MRCLTLTLVLLYSCTTFGCRNGWIQHDSFCFMFSHTQVTWSEATVICEAFGAYLAEPSTQSVDSLLSGESIANHRIYWLGGSDLVTEGEWMWSSTQELFTYTNWLSTDPNNGDIGEDCLLNNWRGDGKWGDYDCEHKEYFVCQIGNELPQTSVIG